MPAKVPHRCGRPGCPHTTPCPVHAPRWSGARKAELPDDWPVRRATVLRRDGYRCYLCGGLAVEVDHVRRGNDHHLSNLGAICDPCHRRKSGREGAAARAAHVRGKR